MYTHNMTIEITTTFEKKTCLTTNVVPPRARYKLKIMQVKKNLKKLFKKTNKLHGKFGQFLINHWNNLWCHYRLNSLTATGHTVYEPTLRAHTTYTYHSLAYTESISWFSPVITAHKVTAWKNSQPAASISHLSTWICFLYYNIQ